MADEEPKGKEKDTDLTAELAKYKDMADRYKRQRDEAKQQLDEMKTKQQEIEQKLNELSKIAEQKRQEDLAAKGEYEKLKQELEDKLKTLEQAKEQYEKELTTYRERDKAELEKLLTDRDDAEEIRAEIDGLPLPRQLSIARRLTAASQQPNTPPSSSGTPKGRSNTDAKLDAVLQDPDFVKFAKASGIREEKELKEFAQLYIEKGGEA